MLRLPKKNPSSKLSNQAQTAIEYLLLLSVVAAIVLIAFNGNYLGRVFNAANLYFDRTAVGIYGNVSTLGDGKCEPPETYATDPLACDPPPPPANGGDCDPGNVGYAPCLSSLPGLTNGAIYTQNCPGTCTNIYGNQLKVQCNDNHIAVVNACDDPTNPSCRCNTNPAACDDREACPCDPECAPETPCVLDHFCDNEGGETVINCPLDCGTNCDTQVTINGDCPGTSNLPFQMSHNQSQLFQCSSKGCSPAGGGIDVVLSCYNGVISQNGACVLDLNNPPVINCPDYTFIKQSGACAGDEVHFPATNDQQTATGNCPGGCQGTYQGNCQSGRWQVQSTCIPSTVKDCVGGELRKVGTCSTKVTFPDLNNGQRDTISCPSGCLPTSDPIFLECSNGKYDTDGSCVNSSVPPKDPSKCGNKVCDFWEDTTNCSDDCKELTPYDPADPDKCNSIRLLSGSCPVALTLPELHASQSLVLSCPEGCENLPGRPPIYTCDPGGVQSITPSCQPVDEGDSTANCGNRTCDPGDEVNCPQDCTSAEPPVDSKQMKSKPSYPQLFEYLSEITLVPGLDQYLYFDVPPTLTGNFITVSSVNSGNTQCGSVVTALIPPSCQSPPASCITKPGCTVNMGVGSQPSGSGLFETGRWCFKLNLEWGCNRYHTFNALVQ